MGEMEEGVSVEREFENCRGYNWPCEDCTAPNCPERKAGYKPTASELEEQMYGRSEDCEPIASELEERRYGRRRGYDD